jgi:hypothetical protein
MKKMCNNSLNQSYLESTNRNKDNYFTNYLNVKLFVFLSKKSRKVRIN